MTPWMMMLPIEMHPCWSILGTATWAMRPSMDQEKRFPFSSGAMPRRRRSTASTARTQLTPWHRKVAQATPATPMSKAVTKRISTPMLDTEETARNQKGVLLSPRAEKIPVETL